MQDGGRASPAAALTRYVIATVVAGGTAVTAAALLLPVGDVEPAGALVLVGLAMVAPWFPVRFRHRRGTQGFTTEEAAFLGLLFVMPAAWAPAAMTLVAALAHGVRIREPMKVAFNVGQIGLWSTAGTVVFHLVGPTDGVLAPRSLVAAVAAVIVLNGVSLAAMAELFRRLQERPYRETLSEILHLNAVTAGGNLALGLLFAFTAVADPRATLIASVLLVVTSMGYRGYASAMEERRRNGMLDRVSLTLADVGGSDASVVAFLGALGRLFGAGYVELALADGEGFRFVHHDAAGAHWTDVPSEPALAEVLGVAARAQRDGSADVDALLTDNDTLAVPMIYQGRLVGALVVADRSGFEPSSDSDATLLGTLAHEAAAVLKNVELFAAVERERGRLAAESAKLGEVVNAASDGIAMIEADGTVAVWNAAMERSTGIEASTAVGLPWDLAFRARDDEGRDLAGRTDSVVHRILEGVAEATVIDVQVLRRDGDWRWLRCSVSPTARPGALDGAVIVARDVTREREVAELKGDFVATVSHELRTPLTPLRGFFETLRSRRDRLDDKDTAIIFDSMGSQLDRLERLVGDLLLVADAHHGVLRLSHEPVDLERTARQEVYVALTPDERTRTEIVPAAGPVFAAGDAAAVERIGRALVSNGLKHAQGAVTVRTYEHDGRAVLEVADEGPGIAPWEHERIFERFARLGDHLHRVQGSGLGLSIARSLARAQGGDIELDSDVGQGSVFRLVLPPAAAPGGAAIGRAWRPTAVPPLPAAPDDESAEDAAHHAS